MNLLSIKYWLEVKFTQLLYLFGYKKSTSPIPKGYYCYGREKEETKACPYYRWTKKTQGTACTYLPFYGFDVCLFDQCKICGIKIDKI